MLVIPYEKAMTKTDEMPVPFRESVHGVSPTEKAFQVPIPSEPENERRKPGQ